MTETTPRPALFVSVDSHLDMLVACPYGTVCDGTPSENWEGVTEEIGLLHDGEDGPIVGLAVNGLTDCNPEAIDEDLLWSGPRFDVPILGLVNVSAGEVIVAARDHFKDSGTFNCFLFGVATGTDDLNMAERIWRQCLGAGDMKAHYGLGYTLLDLGRSDEAYHHLRYYTEIAPNQPWAWRYRGLAAEAVGDPGDARRSYRRAIALTADGGEDTDALDLLATLDAQLGPRRRKPHASTVALWGEELLQAGRSRIESCGDSLATAIKTGEYSMTGSHDAVATIQLDACDVLVCAKGHGGEAAGHVALRALLDELADIKNPAALTADELLEVWDQVRVRMDVPADLADGIGTTASVTLALVCCDAVLWSAVGDAQLAFVGESGSVTFPDPGSGEGDRLDWQLERDEFRSRLRTGSLPIAEDGRVVLHSELAEAHDELSEALQDVDIPVDLGLGLLLRLQDCGFAVAVGER